MYAVTGSSQNVRVTIQREGSSLKRVLNDIEEQTEYLFIINSNIDTQRKVTVKVDKEPLAEVLNGLSEQIDMKYAVSQKHIILSKAEPERLSRIHQQSSEVKGFVVDEMGEPLIGVNVIIQNKTNGAISNVEGYFELDAKIGDVLIVSYIGYVTQK